MNGKFALFDMTRQEYEALIQVPLGRAYADKVIINAELINVYAGKIQSGVNVAIKGNRIAYVGTKTDNMIGEETEILDAKGLFLAPGYIDPHGHTDFGANPIALANEILPHGTTTILTETKSQTAALQSWGIQAMLDMTENLPLKFFYCITAANPLFPHLEGEDSLPMEEFAKFIEHPRVLAISELVAFVRALELDDTVLSKLELGRRLHKRLEGHGSGCSPETLNALINVGITSCHEAMSAEEIKQRVYLGLPAMLRHGSIISDMEPLVHAVTSDPELDTRWLMLTPDWFSPGDILATGYMQFLVGKAIEYGIPPVKAIQMVTINAALYLGLDRYVGGIGPSRFADILFLADPSLPDPLKVMVNGEIIAEQGQLKQKLPLNCPSFTTNDWRPGRVPTFKATAEHFVVKAAAAEGEYQQVPVIKVINRTITKLDHVDFPVKSDKLVVEDKDILKISMLHISRERFANAFIKGFGASIGGLATSTAHDHHTPYVIGNNDADMALAFNRLLEINGGLVLVDDGAIIAECQMVIGGIMSDKDVSTMDNELQVIEQYLLDRGCHTGPVVTLYFLSHTGVPFVRITPSGLYDVRSKQVLFS